MGTWKNRSPELAAAVPVDTLEPALHKINLVMVGNGMAGVCTIEELLKIAPARSF